MTRFRTVLFDLDGTLIDHFSAIHRTHCETLSHFGLPDPSMEAIHRAVGGGFEVAVQRVLGPEHQSLLPQAIPFYREAWERNILFDVRLFPGAREVLEALQAAGVHRAVFTNKHGPSARRVCTHLGLDVLLDGIFGAFDTPWLKPDLAFTQHVLTALQAEAKTSCLVGDSPYDVQTGQRAGFPCFCVTTGTHHREDLVQAGADGVYPDLFELGRSALELSL